MPKKVNFNRADKTTSSTDLPNDSKDQKDQDTQTNVHKENYKDISSQTSIQSSNDEQHTKRDSSSQTTSKGKKVKVKQTSSEPLKYSDSDDASFHKFRPKRNEGNFALVSTLNFDNTPRNSTSIQRNPDRRGSRSSRSSRESAGPSRRGSQNFKKGSSSFKKKRLRSNSYNSWTSCHSQTDMRRRYFETPGSSLELVIVQLDNKVGKSVQTDRCIGCAQDTPFFQTVRYRVFLGPSMDETAISTFDNFPMLSEFFTNVTQPVLEKLYSFFPACADWLDGDDDDAGYIWANRSTECFSQASYSSLIGRNRSRVKRKNKSTQTKGTYMC